MAQLNIGPGHSSAAKELKSCNATKPLEWVTSLLTRFEEQLPVKAGPLNHQARLLVEHSQTCLINVGKQKLGMVVNGLIRMLQTLNSMLSCSEEDLFESQCIILDTLEHCLSEIPPKDSPTRLGDSQNLKIILHEMCQFLQLPSHSNQSLQLKDRASKVLLSLSISNSPAVLQRLSVRMKLLGSDAPPEALTGDPMADIELIQHIHMDKTTLIKLLRELCYHRPFRKENSYSLALAISVEKAIWNWMDSYPDEFAELKRTLCSELTECCDSLFEQLDSESGKKKACHWPLQMMLLILCPRTLEEIFHAACGSSISPKHERKKQFFDGVKKLVTGSWSIGSHSQSKHPHHLVAACVAGVKLCRAATYINVHDFYANTLFSLLQEILEPLKLLLFSTTKSVLFRSGSSSQDPQELDVMIDFFIALFRLKYDNEAFKFCLTAQTNNPPFQLVLVIALYRISIQPRLVWWPKIELVYSRSQDLRNMFNETLNRVSQGVAGWGPVSALSPSGHMPLRVTQSLQKIMTGKLKEKGPCASFSMDEQPSIKQLLFWLIRLICTEPTLFLHERASRPNVDAEVPESHNSTSELISGLVTLMSQSSTIPDIAQEAMEALLCLHRPENIRLWNPDSPLLAMEAFWYISSQLIFSVCQKLLHHQLSNYPEVLRWLRQLLILRNSFLLSNRDIANHGSNEHLCRQAAIKLETVCFLYLWSFDNDAVLTSMSMFRLLCEEAEIKCDIEDLPPEYYVHAELALASNLQSVGRLVLQKSVYAYLRRIKTITTGCQQAWEDTFRIWEGFTKFLKAYPRSRSDEGFQAVDNLHRILTQRRSTRSQDQELEEIVNIWANMTGFLCALGGVCSHVLPPQPPCVVSGSLDYVHSGSAVRTACRDAYCPVTLFLSQMLSLLVSYSESDVGDPPVYIRHLKELLSYELNPILYPSFFQRIRICTDRFFDTTGLVCLTDSNSEFLKHIVYVMRMILAESAPSSPLDRKEQRSLAGIHVEPIMLSICRYIRYLDFRTETLTVKAKVCHLIEMIMQRREKLVFRAEVRFRNRLIEHVTDWLMEHHPTSPQGLAASSELSLKIREVDVVCMSAVSRLLLGLPLQPEETERDILDAKSQLFQRYFSLFMNLLNNCLSDASSSGSLPAPPAPALHSHGLSTPTQDGPSGTESETASLRGEVGEASSGVVTGPVSSYYFNPLAQRNSKTRSQQNEQRVEKLRQLTVEAMSSLLASNIDAGLVHAIGLGYHHDLRVRSAFIEVLTRVLQEGMEFETLNETVLADRYQELLKLVTMITDDGDLPIALALAHVVQSQQLDELARALVTAFDAKHLLYELCWKIFSKEVELADTPNTIFRGNTLASKVMGYCFRIYGASYLHTLLRPFIESVSDVSYEVDPSRLDPGEELSKNIENVLNIVEKVFSLVVRSHERFPHQLKSLCHCLYQVVNARFPNSGLAAVEMIVFLRFVNPAIVSPFEHGLTDQVPSPRIRRGLMLVSKILQQIANQATFMKEQCLQPFNIFIQSRMDHAKKFVSYITISTGAAESVSHSISFVSEAQILALHRLLWSCQDDISKHLAGFPAYTTLSRRLATLLAQIGAPPSRPSDPAPPWSSIDLTGRRFEEIMAEHNMAEREEYKSIQSLNIFYAAGQSKVGNPVYCYIARRFKLGDVDGDALIYHVILTLKAHKTRGKPFELILDLTHTSSENRFRTDTLQRWFVALPEAIVENLHACYIYNCNSWVRDYVNFHHRLMSSLRGHKKLMFLDNMMKLNDFVDSDQHMLPTATLALKEDLKSFPNALRLWHKDVKCVVKVGPTALQLTTMDKQKILGHSVKLVDIYYASEIEEVCLVDDNNITLTILNEPSPLSIIHNDCEQIVTAIVHIRTRHELAQPEHNNFHSKIRAKDVPGTLLNTALLNLGSGDPTLRPAAYNLLCALAATFDFKLEDKLLETQGLLIPANNTIFIRQISARLAANEPRLSLEFLEECIQGFRQSSSELKHVCLEYMTPWLSHLPRFLKQGEDQKKQKVIQIIERLIILTIDETELYPLFQAKVWGTIGQEHDLLDLVLEAFIKKSVAGGLGSIQAETLADTTVALASANVECVARIIVNKLILVLERSCATPVGRLEENPYWDDVGVLARYLLLLSFNNCLDVISHLPYIFHFITVLVNCGPLPLRASIHGLVTNIIHSLCTSTHPSFSEETKRTLRLALTEFSLPKFYRLFGISHLTVKAVASSAFNVSLEWSKSVGHGALSSLGEPGVESGREDELSLADLQCISDTLIEVLEACQQDMPTRNLVAEWSQIAFSFAFRYNPALQPRGLVVYSCLAKETTEHDVNRLLSLLVQAVKRREDPGLISALLMAITRLHPQLPHDCWVHKILFWVAIIVFQLEDAELYEHALALLEQNLRTLDSHGAFEYQTLEKVMMEVRSRVEWEFKALDQQIGLSFRHNFHFAVVGHLIKGLRCDGSYNLISSTSRVLNLFLTLIAKLTKRDRLEVTPESLPYLLPLLPYSEEVRRRCHLNPITAQTLSMSGSSETLTWLRAGLDDGMELATHSSMATTPMEISDAGQATSPERHFSGRVPIPPNSSSGFFALPTIATPSSTTTPTSSVQLPKVSSLRPATSSWRDDCLDSTESWAKQRRDSHKCLEDDSRRYTGFSLGRKPRLSARSHSLPLSEGNVKEEQEGEGTEKESTGLGPPGSKEIKTRTAASRRRQKSSSRVDRFSMHESNILLDPDHLNGQDLQALALTVLATLVRNTSGESESRVLFEYLAEASVLFPKIFPVIHGLIDVRLTQTLQRSHDPGLVRAVLHIVANMVPGEGEEAALLPEDHSQQQHISYLQAYGFGGLWRFAGPFLSKTASQQAMTAEICSCLERLVGLGDPLPLTPPAPSPRLPTSPLVSNFPHGVWKQDPPPP